MIRVLAVDDHPVVREGVRTMLAVAGGIELVGEGDDAQSALELAKQLTPDVMLLDVRLPGMDGIQITRRMKRELPQMAILLLTVCEEETYLFEAMRAGADGYVLKNCRADFLIGAIRSVASGEKVIDPRLVGAAVKELTTHLEASAVEKSGLDSSGIHILRMAAEGLTNREIAAKVHLSEVSVQKKLQIVYERLGAADRAQAVAEAFRRGLIT